ncbi:LmeA family phospholipid-binding protein [Nocardia sp. CDC153]|uniref:LmeA family phospholipid-binding protein n=1 Tax=Nocardia sp. CDC153 TaxID=3112167 RepID=UPI002DBB7251|nr:LmeA family phospholipid-binding protein [Nocardia sp. CDC153]MEC3955288.1 LmeA family phospholipid-binding protein [Nocardia sp. CDC153]
MRFRRLLIGLLCLAGLAVLLDFGVAAYSEYRVSRLLRTGSSLSADPAINFHESLRHPFVVQAMDGDFLGVDIRARTMRPDIPGQISVEADLTGIHLSMRNLVDGNVRKVPVDEVTGRVRFEPTELGRVFQIPDLQVYGPYADSSDISADADAAASTATPTKAAALILQGTVPIGPDADAASVTDPRDDSRDHTTKKTNAVKVHVLAEMRLDGDQIRITATAISGRDLQADTDSVLPGQQRIVVPEADRPAVLAHFTRTIDIKNMPFGMAPAKVQASGGQLVVTGTATETTVDLDRLQP